MACFVMVLLRPVPLLQVQPTEHNCVAHGCSVPARITLYHIAKPVVCAAVVVIAGVQDDGGGVCRGLRAAGARSLSSALGERHSRTGMTQ